MKIICIFKKIIESFKEDFLKELNIVNITIILVSYVIYLLIVLRFPTIFIPLNIILILTITYLFYQDLKEECN